ncbi:MAG: serine--tRNA ligase, partial [Candidatus Saccharimonadales bacterium]
MLDIQFIRDNQRLVEETAKNKNVKVDVKKLVNLDEERRSLQAETDELRRERNELSRGQQGKPTPTQIKKGKDLKNKISKAESRLEKVEKEFVDLMYALPNVASKDTPVGPDESANKVLRKCGKPTKFNFEPKDHLEIGESLGLIDTERAAKVSGARFTYLLGDLALMQFSLLQFVMAILTSEKTLQKIIKKAGLNISSVPFVPVVPPVMVRRDVFAALGRLEPAEDKYYLEEDQLFLAGSAEHTLAPLHMGEIINPNELPKRYVGYSTCFRREAGSYGKDVRGILRQHQFEKIEMESFTLPEESTKEQDLMVAIQEYIMQELGLPYQVVAISTGDMGKPDFRQIDIETWLPAQKTYRET